MIRPTCAVVQQVLQAEHVTPTPSLGCVGYPVYTELEDSELYCAIPGVQMGRVVTELEKDCGSERCLKRVSQSAVCVRVELRRRFRINPHYGFRESEAIHAVKLEPPLGKTA